MKKRLSFSETLTVGSMLFGLFFGAGNLIFPVYMGQSAGSHFGAAAIGFLITAVGIPLMCVAAIGMSRSSSLLDMSRHAGQGYGYFFTCLLYLTIGPFFAIPRCASTSFTVGLAPMIQNESTKSLATWIFSLLFFAAVLWFSLKPGKLLTYVGKVLTPLFLVSLDVLAVTALVRPIGDASLVVPEESYQNSAFFQGFLDGYNTMDVLAGLAFGIVVVDAIRRLGVEDPAHIAGNTVLSGIAGCVIMALIYVALTIIGAQSRAVYPLCANGGDALYLISTHYFGSFGAVVLAVIVTLACLKTAVGLITSCGEMFRSMFPKGPSYTVWAVGFCILSFLIATLGLSAIITYSLPVLMFLYPLAITITVVALLGKLYNHDKAVYMATTIMTLIPSVFDFLKALLSDGALNKPEAYTKVCELGERFFPMFDLGLGWVLPSLIGFVIGLAIHIGSRLKKKA